MHLLKSSQFLPGCWLALTLAAVVSLHAAMPPKPAGGDFLHDYAGVIPAETQQTIRELQATAFREGKTPIVVVTVPSLQRYSLGTNEVEAYARTWFNTWGIGSQKKNNGILVLLAVEERRARIELGAEWGRRWDDYAKQVMDGKMVPRFKVGEYGAGLRAGVEALARMAALGPAAEPPQGSALDKFLGSELGYYAVYDNPLKKQFGPRIVWALVLVGVMAFVLLPFLPNHRRMLLIIGFGAIGLAFLFWIVAVIIGLFVGRNRRKDEDSSSSGGGYGGGSSGGGGATGKW